MLKDIKKIVKHTTIYGLGSILSKAVGFLLIPLYTHYLTPRDYGVLELLDLTVSVAAIFVGLGIAASIFRFYYHYETASDKNEVVSTALIFVVIIASVVVAFAIGSASSISALVFKSSEFLQYFVWMFVSFLFSTIASVPETYIIAQQRSALFMSITIGTLIVNLSLNIFVVAFLKMGVMGIVYVSAFVRALNACLLLLLTVPRVGLSFSVPKLREMLKYGLPLLPANVGLFVITFADRFFLSQLCSLSTVGIYALGYKFGFMISILLVQPFNRIWQVQRFELAQKDDAPRILGNMFTYFSFVVIFAVLGLSVFIKDVVKIIAAPEFWSAYKVVFFIAMSCFFSGAYNFFQTGILLKKETKYVGYSVAIAGLLNMVMNYVLIKALGFIGAAISALITNMIMAGFVYVYSQKLFRITYEFFRIFKLFIVALTLCCLSYLVTVDSPVMSALVKSAFICSFPFVLFVVKFYTNKEKGKFAEIGNFVMSKISNFRAS
jgi:O-antigen/teichoic acid export membrane protein